MAAQPKTMRNGKGPFCVDLQELGPPRCDSRPGQHRHRKKEPVHQQAYQGDLCSNRLDDETGQDAKAGRQQGQENAYETAWHG